MVLIPEVKFAVFRAGLLVFFELLLLSSCQSGDVNAPVRNIGEHGKYHIVRKGDTLYSIAWRYDNDYKRLAKTNGIAPPYTIYIGQKISIRAQKSTSAPGKSAAQVEKSQSRSRSYSKKVTPAIIASGSLKWDWPLEGEIISGFSLQGKVNKGINIAGKTGTGVKAAAAGIVVYAGGNLRGYGKLVIIKHDNRFLSAYGNNRAIRVKEGQGVKVGQVLAEVGSSGANVEMLHFEIRIDGIPVNPVNYLPGRPSSF